MDFTSLIFLEDVSWLSQNEAEKLYGLYSRSGTGAMPGAFKRAKKYLLGEPGNPRP